MTGIDPLSDAGGPDDAGLGSDSDDFGEIPADRRLTPSEQKLQRWVDLLAALLIRHLPADFETLAADVPGYDLDHTQRESVLRTFERDKDELRRFGVPIDTVTDGEGETIGYRLERKKFYLPYLVVAAQERATYAARRLPMDGYRSLETLAFEPDELEVIAEAAARVRSLGDPVLAQEAQTAIRKLALDLPLGVVAEVQVSAVAARMSVAFEQPRQDYIVPPRRPPEPTVFERLSDALARRKVVTFDYYTIERDDRARRTVEPYGLFFVSSHWYLAGRDVERDAIRNFRLSRISRAEVNEKKANTADYTLPETFTLRDHAQAREPWEIGDGDARTAIVDFVAATGATQAALELGRAVPGNDRRREFDVRRTDAFARWLLSFGGDARPVAPPELVAEYERQAEATLRMYV